MNTIDESYKALGKRAKNFPETVVILGSGWNKVLGNAKVIYEVSYSELFGVEASVPGHEGKLVIAKINSHEIAFMSGRFHMYEGFSAREATLPIRLFSKLGVKKLILTAACGAINEKYKVGDFIVLSDIITLFLALDSPLRGPEFVDVSSVFNEALRHDALKTCINNKIPVHEGVYCYYHGPNYETPADKMALRFLGADVVGMSTVPETISARSLGIDVLALAFVTNLAFVKHDHKDVVAQANKASESMALLLKQVLST